MLIPGIRRNHPKQRFRLKSGELKIVGPPSAPPKKMTATGQGGFSQQGSKGKGIRWFKFHPRPMVQCSFLYDGHFTNPFYIGYLFKMLKLKQMKNSKKWGKWKHAPSKVVEHCHLKRMVTLLIFCASPKPPFGVTNRWLGRHDWPQSAASTTTVDLKLANKGVNWAAFHEIESAT